VPRGGGGLGGEARRRSAAKRCDLLGANANKNSKEADAKVRQLKDEADATRAKAAQIKNELAASLKELESLRSILATG
jgi:hypothetical protein